ncbi:hypothetical protein Taro_004799 [Colocasia esculenta]|uniref:Uncharacterized protein n=1 Tax=Colocasia esculenta TaxID=4460 RepID=A0A843TSP5_COLES|nr:hypothetical protein [Colocasia esculenta]
MLELAGRRAAKVVARPDLRWRAVMETGGTNIFMQKMCRHTHQWCRHNNTDSKAKCVKMLRLCRHESRVCRHELQFFRNQSTQVDTLTEQVDTLSGQVDTRPSSQNSQFEELGQQVDTLSEQVDTGPSSQNNLFIIRTTPLKHSKEADPVEDFFGEEFEEDPTSQIAEYRLGLQASQAVSTHIVTRVDTHSGSGRHTLFMCRHTPCQNPF